MILYFVPSEIIGSNVFKKVPPPIVAPSTSNDALDVATNETDVNVSTEESVNVPYDPTLGGGSLTWPTPPFVDPVTGRANATIVMLARNSELEGVISSIMSMESKFNADHNYPWVFLNEEPFIDEFVVRVSAATNASVQFGLIPDDNWFQPEWIDEEKATKSRERMTLHNVIYASSVPYRNMCRFNSGVCTRLPHTYRHL